MCEDCFENGFYKFESQNDFEKFESLLDKKCNNLKIEIIDRYEENELSIFDSRLYYKCTNCNENWVMSIPDNAWRGYFLPVATAIKHHEELRRSDKKKAIGCWAVLVVILIILAINYMN